MGNFLKAFFWLYLIVILVISFIPITTEAPTSDKINHFIKFFIFSILLKEAYQTSYWGNFFYCVFLSIFTEAVQYFLPYRSGEYGDIVADLLGATSGLFMYFVVKLAFMELKIHK